VDWSDPPPRHSLLQASLLWIVCTCVLLAAIVLRSAPVIGPILAGCLIMFALAVAIGVYQRRSLLLKSLMTCWLIVTSLAVLLSPALASIPLIMFTPTTATGRQWFNSGNLLAASVVLTLLFLASELAAALTVFFWANDHDRFPPRHLCVRCGYDLRATPDIHGPRLERCPECGEPA